MKYLKQFGIILMITLAAEMLETWIPLPIPASIYGLLILFILLLSGKLKLDAVEETGNFLIEIMPLMFIPAAVGLIESYRELEGLLIPAVLVIIVTTIIVMGITGRTAQWLLTRKEKGTEDE